MEIHELIREIKEKKRRVVERADSRRKWDFEKAKENKVDRSKLGGGWLGMGLSRQKLFFLLREFEKRGLVKKSGRLVEPDVNPWGLFYGHVRFILAFLNPTKDTYCNAHKAALKAGYSARTGDSLIQNPVINMTIRELLNRKEIDEQIVSGVVERLQDSKSKNWLPTADYVAKIRGDYAPEKHVAVNLTAEDREKEYEAIYKKVKQIEELPDADDEIERSTIEADVLNNSLSEEEAAEILFNPELNQELQNNEDSNQEKRTPALQTS